MKTRLITLLVAAMGLLALVPGGFTQPKNGIERFYVLYCGDIALTDMGRFRPAIPGREPCRSPAT